MSKRINQPACCILAAFIVILPSTQVEAQDSETSLGDRIITELYPIIEPIEDWIPNSIQFVDVKNTDWRSANEVTTAQEIGKFVMTEQGIEEYQLQVEPEDVKFIRGLSEVFKASFERGRKRYNRKVGGGYIRQSTECIDFDSDRPLPAQTEGIDNHWSATVSNRFLLGLKSSRTKSISWAEANVQYINGARATGISVVEYAKIIWNPDQSLLRVVPFDRLDPEEAGWLTQQGTYSWKGWSVTRARKQKMDASFDLKDLFSFSASTERTFSEKRFRILIGGLKYYSHFGLPKITREIDRTKRKYELSFAATWISEVDLDLESYPVAVDETTCSSGRGIEASYTFSNPPKPTPDQPTAETANTKISGTSNAGCDVKTNTKMVRLQLDVNPTVKIRSGRQTLEGLEARLVFAVEAKEEEGLSTAYLRPRSANGMTWSLNASGAGANILVSPRNLNSSKEAKKKRLVKWF